MSRRTMLAPIRPRPIMPSCIFISSVTFHSVYSRSCFYCYAGTTFSRLFEKKQRAPPSVARLTRSPPEHLVLERATMFKRQNVKGLIEAENRHAVPLDF